MRNEDSKTKHRYIIFILFYPQNAYFSEKFWWNFTVETDFDHLNRNLPTSRISLWITIDHSKDHSLSLSLSEATANVHKIFYMLKSTAQKSEWKKVE